MADAPECYIPLRPDPERLARNLAIMREAGERLGILPRSEEQDSDDA